MLASYWFIPIAYAIAVPLFTKWLQKYRPQYTVSGQEFNEAMDNAVDPNASAAMNYSVQAFPGLVFLCLAFVAYHMPYLTAYVLDLPFEPDMLSRVLGAWNAIVTFLLCIALYRPLMQFIFMIAVIGFIAAIGSLFVG